MLIMALVVIGAAVVHAARRGSLPVRRSAERDGAHVAAGRIGGRSRKPALGHPRRSGQQSRRHQRAAFGLGAGPVDVEHHVQSRSQHRRRGAGRARPRAIGGAPPARRHRAADDHEAGQRPRSEPLDRAVGPAVDSRAHRDRGQDRQGAARADVRRRRGADRRRPRARHEHLGRGRSARRLQALDRRGPQRACSNRTRTFPAATSRPTSTSGRCARWAASPTPRSSTTW